MTDPGARGPNELEARALVGALPDAVLLVERDLRVSWWNAAAGRVLGWSEEGAPAAPLADIYWDAGQGKSLALVDGLTHVFLNLVLNALHAVRAPGAGDGPHRVRVEVSADAGQVRIAVIDTGCGIDPEQVPHIFDPFYTSKAAGDGVGLGLAISRSIIASISGDIRVESELGVGSRFTVVLPAV